MCLCVAAGTTAGAAEDSTGKPAESKLPPYDFGYTNPLYATISGYLSIKDIELTAGRTGCWAGYGLPGSRKPAGTS